MVISDGAPVDDSTLSVNPGNYLERHLRQVIERDRDALAGRADRHRHRPRRDPLLPPRRHHRRRRGARRRDDREARRAVRGEGAGVPTRRRPPQGFRLRPSRRSVLIGGGSAIVAAALAGKALAGRPQAFGEATPISVQANPISYLSVTDPDRVRFGDLAFRSGLELRSSTKEFGGFSSLWRSPNGRDLVALADNAQWLRGRLETADGRLSGLTEAALTRPDPGQRQAPAPHAVLRYGEPCDRGEHGLCRGRASATPFCALRGTANHSRAVRRSRCRPASKIWRAMQVSKRWPSRRRVRRLRAPWWRSPSASPGFYNAVTRGYVLTGASRGEFDVVRSDGFDISDMAFLPNGELLLLERRFSYLGGFATRLRRVAAGSIGPGSRVDGAIIFESDASRRSTTRKAWPSTGRAATSS